MCDAQQFDSETYWQEQFRQSQQAGRLQRLENLEARVQRLEQIFAEIPEWQAGA